MVRTHFLTANGELLLIENHLLRNMSISNLSRSVWDGTQRYLQLPARHVPQTPNARLPTYPTYS